MSSSTKGASLASVGTAVSDSMVAWGSQKLSTAATTFDGSGFNFGYWHACEEQTNVYAMFSTAKTDDNTKDTMISLGINHSFDAML